MVTAGTLGQDLGEIRAEKEESHRPGFFGKQRFTCCIKSTVARARAFSGKVETGFPSENATKPKKLECIEFPSSLNALLPRRGPDRRYPSVRPIARNFSRRCRRMVSRSSPCSCASAWAIASPVDATAAAGSRWAPPGGSVTIWSMTPNRTMSSAVIFMPVAASCALVVSRHRIDAAPSGEITL